MHLLLLLMPLSIRRQAQIYVIHTQHVGKGNILFVSNKKFFNKNIVFNGKECSILGFET